MMMFCRDRIATLREAKGLSQKQLAEELSKFGLNVRRETVTQWEAGTREVKEKYIVALAKFFDVSSDYLLGLPGASKTEITVQSVSNYIGLTNNFVSWLESHKDYAPQIERLSKLMIENGFIGGDSSEQE